MAEKTVPKAPNEGTPSSREETRHPEHYVAPKVDIYEQPDGLVVVADLPGVPDEKLDIRIDDGILTIRGEPEHLLQEEPVYREYNLTRFFRQFELPESVDQQKTSGELKNGVLTLKLPKAEKAKPRKIDVKLT